MTHEVVELTVLYVNPVKPGGKLGSIKSAEGTYYNVLPAMLREFRVGEVCTIEFSTSADGRFKRVEKKIASAHPPTHSTGESGPPLPAPPRPRTHSNDQVHIFVTALLGHFIDAGKVSLNEDMIAEACNMILRAYRKCDLGSMRVE